MNKHNMFRIHLTQGTQMCLRRLRDIIKCYNFRDVIKCLTTKAIVITISGRKHQIYDVLETLDLRHLKNAEFRRFEEV